MKMLNKKWDKIDENVEQEAGIPRGIEMMKMLNKMRDEWDENVENVE